MVLSRTKTAIYSLMPAVLLFTALEVSARIWEHWHPPLIADYGSGFDAENRLYLPADDVPGRMITNPSKKMSFGEVEFLMPKPPHCSRVFVTGGSTIRNAQPQLWAVSIALTRQLGRPCQVIDAGGTGYGTRRLVTIVSEIMAYQPDVVVLSTGNNEFVDMEQLELARLEMLPLQKVLYRSAFCRFFRDRIAAYELARRRQDRNRRIPQSTPNMPESQELSRGVQRELDERMNELRGYLTAIAKICQDHHVALIFGTTPSNLVSLFKPNPPHDLPPELLRANELYDAGQYQECLAIAREYLRCSYRPQASDAENEIIRDVASKNNIPLADTEAAVIAAEPHHIPGETLFTDHCHFTEDGTKIMCDVFKDAIHNIVKDK